MAHPKKKISLSRRKKRRTHYKRKNLLPILLYNKIKNKYQVYHNISIKNNINKKIYFYKNKKIVYYK
ncbi:MAG: 50S ribosomal protein L32 [Candidatus Shikimatogenerans bostrichidophilus]|nr:MAG: 50S ribosomal protein L32 [Candidatus Shikimatogenerans bostrichidophilus]